jgi:COMPASS component SPP1
MIGCEICEDWFHGNCISIDKSEEPLIDKYICPNCEAQGKGTTVWLRKCRLEGCKVPALAAVKGTKGAMGFGGSKYCSEEHGIEFFRTRLLHLDDETLSKRQLKTIVSTVNGIEEFKSLGEEEPAIPDSTLLQFKTPEDESKLSDLRLEREKISRKREILHLRQSFLSLAIEKAKQLNSDIKLLAPVPTGKSKVKTKEICAFDPRFSLDDVEFLEWSVSPEGKKVLSERRIEDSMYCDTEKRRCRHHGWQGLRGEDIITGEQLLAGQLDEIARQEKIIRYPVVRRWLMVGRDRRLG